MMEITKLILHGSEMETEKSLIFIILKDGARFGWGGGRKGGGRKGWGDDRVRSTVLKLMILLVTTRERERRRKMVGLARTEF